MNEDPAHPRQSDLPPEFDKAVAALRAGEVVAVPTDTVYGFAVDPSVPDATARIFAMKRRPDHIDLPILIADPAEAEALAATGAWSPAAARLAKRFWPGPLTVIVARRPGIDWELGAAADTIGIRCPDHDLVRKLGRAVGPLAVTSANRHGHPPLEVAEMVRERFAGELAVVLDGGRCSGSPSTVVDLTSPELRCVRQGGIPWAQVVAAAEA